MEYQHKFQVIFDGIDTEVARPDASAFVTLARRGLRFKAGDEVVTFVNRNLEPYRGFHIFMRALPELLALRPQAHVIIVGKDDVSYGARPAGGGTWRQKMLAELGDRLPLDRIHFVGALSYANYLRMLQVSACHVYLTYPFVLSWSCLEAMAVQCPLVASGTAPVREVVDDGVQGRLFDFFDPQALARTVAEVLQHKAAAQAMGAAARQRVLERYDLRSVCLPQQMALLG